MKIFNEYFEYLEKKGYAEKTIDNRKKGLLRFLNFMRENRIADLNRIDLKQIEKYKDYLKTFNLSDTTISDYIARVREMFNLYLFKEKKIKHNPFDEILKKRFEKHHPEMIKKLLDDFQSYLELRDYKPRGIESQLRAVRDYLYYTMEKNIDIYHAGIKDAEGYREYLRLLSKPDGSSRYNPKTINYTISHLETFYSYLLSINKVLRNPFKNMDRMRESFVLPKNILKIEEMKKLLSCIPVKDKNDFKFKVLIEILYATGARISEIEKLRKDDIDLDEGYIRIYDDKDRQDRRAVLTEYAVCMLKMYLKHVYDEENEKVFYHGKKRSLNAWINRRLKDLCIKLEIPVIGCHGIRHTTASHLFKNGADIREVQEYLGHKIIKNTEIYTHVMHEDLKKVVEETHPREKRSTTI